MLNFLTAGRLVCTFAVLSSLASAALAAGPGQPLSLTLNATPRSNDGVSFDPSSGMSLEFRPSLPIFGAGPFVDMFSSNQALENASAHIAWSTAVPLVGEKIGGRKGLWISGLSWMGLSLAQEAFFHAPEHPGPGYPSEVRSDLLTRLGPTAVILILDLLNHRAPAAVAPKVEAERQEVPIVFHLKSDGLTDPKISRSSGSEEKINAAR